MTLFLGQSGQGKSFLIVDTLFKLKDDIPNIIVICPTESQNNTYKGIVPPECIIEDVNSTSLIRKLTSIYNR